MRQAKNLVDAAKGCLLGALVGDAAGATLEFIGHQPSQSEVRYAMTMPGGGVWRVAPGQITDDGELALCLARALAQMDKTFDAFQIEKIAQHYAKWVESNPFDIGNTTQRSLGCFLWPKWQAICETEGYAVGMTDAAAQRCMESKANGSLMRAAPLGIWGAYLSDEQLARCAIADSRLSHPNPSCADAVACYVIAIANLLRHPGNRELAFARASRWADANANQEVRGWLQDAVNQLDVPYQPLDGFIRIAFTHAFRHLLRGTAYQDALAETLAGGGDTDTNACIVGGLIGAACGAGSIPEKMKEAVIACDTRKGQFRPAFFRTTDVIQLINKLV